MCIIIVIAIIVGNIVTQNYTVKSIGILSEELEELKKDVIEAEENGQEDIHLTTCMVYSNKSKC